MSNIYIQEPPTNGKVLLKTTVGEIEVELWSKEAPKATRNFIQCVLNKSYDKTLFHRLVPSFIVQCGENIKLPETSPPLRIEAHSRLRFTRRGLVALAQTEGNEKTMEFFFTLSETPELQNKHSIIGKVTGDTIYNLIKLNDSQTDANDRPLYPHKINKVKILSNPYEDLVPQFDATEKLAEKDSKKPKREGVKNFQLISFGDEAEQDEQEVEKFPKDSEKQSKPKPRSRSPSTSSKKEKDDKSNKRTLTPPPPSEKKVVAKVVEEDSDDSDYEATLEKEKMSELEKKKKEIQDQIKDIKKQYHKDKKEKTKEEEKKPEVKPKVEDDTIQGYLDEKEKYKTKKLPKKGASREAHTMELLAKFKNRLHTALEVTENIPAAVAQDNSDDENWLGHKLDFSESTDAVLAKDASKKEDDWYDIYDPRNPLNKRKRGAEKTDKGESSKVRRK